MEDFTFLIMVYCVSLVLTLTSLSIIVFKKRVVTLADFIILSLASFTPMVNTFMFVLIIAHHAEDIVIFERKDR